MKVKLTLTIDNDTKEQAKKVARQRGTSVSRMVEQFLNSVSRSQSDWSPREGSVVSKLAGSIPAGSDVEYEDVLTDELLKKYGYGKNTR